MTHSKIMQFQTTFYTSQIKSLHFLHSHTRELGVLDEYPKFFVGNFKSKGGTGQKWELGNFITNKSFRRRVKPTSCRDGSKPKAGNENTSM